VFTEHVHVRCNLRRQKQFTAACKARNITFNIWEGKDGKQHHTTLSLSKRIELLQTVKLTDVLLNNERAEKVEILWREWTRLYKIANDGNPKTEEDSQTFRKEAREWLCLFKEPKLRADQPGGPSCGMFDAAKITPYMHMFCEHLPDYLTGLSFELKDASQQGLEGSNGDRKSRYFRMTNRGAGRRKSDAVRDVLRVELMCPSCSAWLGNVRSLRRRFLRWRPR